MTQSKLTHSLFVAALFFGNLVHAQTLSLNYPIGGETIMAGTNPSTSGSSWETTYILYSWSNFTNTPIAFDMYKGSQMVSRVQSTYISLGGSMTAHWVIPAWQEPGADYQIKVVNLNDSSVLSQSGAFSIVAPPVPTVSWISPTAGKCFKRSGKNPLIYMQWSAAGEFATLRLPGTIEILKGETVYKTVVENSWNAQLVLSRISEMIPKTMPLGNDYRVRIRTPSMGYEFVSPYFGICK
ncbi:hypothetical protein [Bdellovibrio sp. HCB-162]|uniref:hypothetical protein n=1 Tax=Bdellovibrio sp. HCB-162 TaxID=3394234 RepID=UPI0039BCE520